MYQLSLIVFEIAHMLIKKKNILFPIFIKHQVFYQKNSLFNWKRKNIFFIFSLNQKERKKSFSFRLLFDFWLSYSRSSELTQVCIIQWFCINQHIIPKHLECINALRHLLFIFRISQKSFSFGFRNLRCFGVII